MKEFATFLEEHGDIINEYYSRIVHEIDIPRQTDKKTALMIACKQNCKSLVDYLINEYNADVKLKDDLGNSAIHFVSNIEIAEILLKNDHTLIYDKNNNDETCIFNVCKHGHIELLNYYLSRKSYACCTKTFYEKLCIFKRNKNLETPFMLAIKHNRIPIIQALQKIF